jgi:hypothetical protein
MGWWWELRTKFEQLQRVGGGVRDQSDSAGAPSQQEPSSGPVDGASGEWSSEKQYTCPGEAHAWWWRGALSGTLGPLAPGRILPLLFTIAAVELFLKLKDAGGDRYQRSSRVAFDPLLRVRDPPPAAPLQQRPADAADLGTCPAFGAKATAGPRYSMEDAWAVVPGLIHIPILFDSRLTETRVSRAASVQHPPQPGTPSGAVPGNDAGRPASPLQETRDGADGRPPRAGGSRSFSWACLGATPVAGGPCGDETCLPPVGAGCGADTCSGSSSGRSSRKGSDEDWEEVATPSSGGLSANSSRTARRSLVSRIRHGASIGIGAPAITPPATPPPPAPHQRQMQPQQQEQMEKQQQPQQQPGRPQLEELHYFGVFDGHGGPEASRHCAKRMHEQLLQTLHATLGGDPSAAPPLPPLTAAERRALCAADKEEEQAATAAAERDCALTNALAREEPGETAPPAAAAAEAEASEASLAASLKQSGPEAEAEAAAAASAMRAVMAAVCGEPTPEVAAVAGLLEVAPAPATPVAAAGLPGGSGRAGHKGTPAGGPAATGESSQVGAREVVGCLLTACWWVPLLLHPAC